LVQLKRRFYDITGYNEREDSKVLLGTTYEKILRYDWERLKRIF